MKTIELVDNKGRRHTFSFAQAEAMLQLGSNCMLQVRIPEDSEYYFDKVIKKKSPKTVKPEKKTRESKGRSRKDQELGAEGESR